MVVIMVPTDFDIVILWHWSVLTAATLCVLFCFCFSPHMYVCMYVCAFAFFFSTYVRTYLSSVSISISISISVPISMSISFSGEGPSGGADGHVGCDEATGGQEADQDGGGEGPGDPGGGAGGTPGVQRGMYVCVCASMIGRCPLAPSQALDMKGNPGLAPAQEESRCSLAGVKPKNRLYLIWCDQPYFRISIYIYCCSEQSVHPIVQYCCFCLLASI